MKNFRAISFLIILLIGSLSFSHKKYIKEGLRPPSSDATPPGSCSGSTWSGWSDGRQTWNCFRSDNNLYGARGNGSCPPGYNYGVDGGCRKPSTSTTPPDVCGGSTWAGWVDPRTKNTWSCRAENTLNYSSQDGKRCPPGFTLYRKHPEACKKQ